MREGDARSQLLPSAREFVRTAREIRAADGRPRGRRSGFDHPRGCGAGLRRIAAGTDGRAPLHSPSRLTRRLCVSEILARAWTALRHSRVFHPQEVRAMSIVVNCACGKRIRECRIGRQADQVPGLQTDPGRAFTTRPCRRERIRREHVVDDGAHRAAVHSARTQRTQPRTKCRLQGDPSVGHRGRVDCLCSVLVGSDRRLGSLHRTAVSTRRSRTCGLDALPKASSARRPPSLLRSSRLR